MSRYGAPGRTGSLRPNPGDGRKAQANLVERDGSSQPRLRVGDGGGHELQGEMGAGADRVGDRLQWDRGPMGGAIEKQGVRSELVADDKSCLVRDQLGEDGGWLRAGWDRASVGEDELRRTDPDRR